MQDLADALLEIPASELGMVLKEAVDFFNQTAALVEEAGVLRGRELSRWIARASARPEGYTIAHREAYAHIRLSPATTGKAPGSTEGPATRGREGGAGGLKDPGPSHPDH